MSSPYSVVSLSASLSADVPSPFVIYPVTLAIIVLSHGVITLVTLSKEIAAARCNNMLSHFVRLQCWFMIMSEVA